MCEHNVEHLAQVFLDCDFAKQCWRVLGLEFDFSNVEYASEWLLQSLADESQAIRVKIATILWGIWSARNLKVWQNKSVTPQMTMQWSVIQVKQ